MSNEQETYKKIEIFEKESDDFFLLLYQNRTLSVGFLVKDILLLLQNGIFEPSDIKKELYSLHSLTVEIEDIRRTISLINKFAFDTVDSFFF
jgi:hypothetical protein